VLTGPVQRDCAWLEDPDEIPVLQGHLHLVEQLARRDQLLVVLRPSTGAQEQEAALPA
jgi:hypothetical protein